MLKTLLFAIIFSLFLNAYELVVVANKTFPEENLSIHDIRSLFLDKKHTIHHEKILVMNHPFNHPLRRCFEEKILHKSPKSLERYWRKAYYQGKRPPKIIKSMAMLFAYLDQVHPSIGYSDTNRSQTDNVQILYTIECDE